MSLLRQLILIGHQTMTQGCFKVFRSEHDPHDIHFAVIEGAPNPIPEDQATLQREVSKTATILRTMFDGDDDRFNRYFPSLLALAQLGLVGKEAQVKLALQALESLRNTLLEQEGGRVKNEYMRKLGVSALIFGAVPLLLGLTLYPTYKYVSVTLLVWGGCMAGCWLSFGLRKVVLEVEDLHRLEDDRVEPNLRLIFTGLLSLVILLMFLTGFSEVTVGFFSTSELLSDRYVAVLIGVICGIGEKALSKRVTNGAATFLN